MNDLPLNVACPATRYTWEFDVLSAFFAWGSEG